MLSEAVVNYYSTSVTYSDTRFVFSFHSFFLAKVYPQPSSLFSVSLFSCCRQFTSSSTTYYPALDWTEYSVSFCQSLSSSFLFSFFVFSGSLFLPSWSHLYFFVFSLLSLSIAFFRWLHLHRAEQHCASHLISSGEVPVDKDTRPCSVLQPVSSSLFSLFSLFFSLSFLLPLFSICPSFPLYFLSLHIHFLLLLCVTLQFGIQLWWQHCSLLPLPLHSSWLYHCMQHLSMGGGGGSGENK